MPEKLPIRMRQKAAQPSPPFRRTGGDGLRRSFCAGRLARPFARTLRRGPLWLYAATGFPFSARRVSTTIVAFSAIMSQS